MANDAIDLVLRRGEILALLGENGAGKTTLMNILFGHYVADEGPARWGDRPGNWSPLAPGSPQAALDAGIGMVHQHFALAESLTVLENVVLGTRPLAFRVTGSRGGARRLLALMADSGLDVPPDRRVSRLSVGEKQRLELLKVLYRGARILVLDEPTALLTPQEVDGLFGVLRRLTANGLSIIFISHKLNEVLAIADRIAVLRAGRKVADRPAAGADRASLATLMVGHAVAQSRRTPRAPGAPLLVLNDVTVTDPHGRAGLLAASLTAHAGEIVGIAGVSGNGQGALAGVIAGTVAPAHGAVTLAGKPLAPSPRATIAAGIGRIPEDRHHEGIVGALSIAENLALETLRGGFLDFATMRKSARSRDPRLRRALSRARRADKTALGRQYPESDFGARARARCARRAGEPADARPRRRRDGRSPPPPAGSARARRRDRADLRGSRRAAGAVRPHRGDRARPALGRDRGRERHQGATWPDDGRQRAEAA